VNLFSPRSPMDRLNAILEDIWSRSRYWPPLWAPFSDGWWRILGPWMQREIREAEEAARDCGTTLEVVLEGIARRRSQVVSVPSVWYPTDGGGAEDHLSAGAVPK